MNTAILREDGAKLLVEVIEDKSDEEISAYKLKMISVLREHPLGCKSPNAGDIFTVWHKRNSGAFSGMWNLERIQNEDRGSAS